MINSLKKKLVRLCRPEAKGPGPLIPSEVSQKNIFALLTRVFSPLVEDSGGVRYDQCSRALKMITPAPRLFEPPWAGFSLPISDISLV